MLWGKLLQPLIGADYIVVSRKNFQFVLSSIFIIKVIIKRCSSYFNNNVCISILYFLAIFLFKTVICIHSIFIKYNKFYQKHVSKIKTVKS